jgi:urea transporter/murein DD-endopeptidase MepM/ murein hydrolase activator NlpD
MVHSYSQVFFSTNTAFAFLIFLVTFMDFFTGLFGLVSVVTANLLARYLQLEKENIKQGYYGFNALLTGMGLGIYFQPGWLLLLIVVVAGILSLFLSVVLQGVIGKYRLPHLTLPFILALWTMMLAGREFTTIGLNERGVYALNDMYRLGGASMVKLYEWWNALAMPTALRAYFLSLGAVLFQYSVLAGILMATGLLLYSRIAFTLSFLGFFTAWYFYQIIGVPITEITYSYIGFNYILTAIAIGGFFIIPRWQSYIWVVVVIPLVALITISLSKVLWIFGLPVYSLPFNIVALGFLYVLQFRTKAINGLDNYFVQYNSPEKNLYAYTSYRERFGDENPVWMHLPFHGEWRVTQAWDGAYTHKGEWRHAFDFEMTDEEGRTYRNAGDYPEDYYCYNKAVLAPANGVVEEIRDDIEDNIIGERDLEHNWGNTIIIKHHENLYSKLSHLLPGSFSVREGDKVKTGTSLARCGNSGNSPYPHLHFQLQATPFVGSKTLPYALNGLLINRQGVQELHVQTIPQLNDLVANVQPHASLRTAFTLVPGQKICWELRQPTAACEQWQVEVDAFYNRYLQCAASGAKAWFRVQDSLFRFTHYEGPKDTLLFYFYLAMQRVSFGYYKGMAIHDQLPLNRVFTVPQLFWQDFIAPFYRYLHATYVLQYPADEAVFITRTVHLKGKITRRGISKARSEMLFELVTDANGLQRFVFDNGKQKWEAICSDQSACS